MRRGMRLAATAVGLAGRDPATHARMKARAIARAQDFLAERIVPLYEQLYQDVLSD